MIARSRELAFSKASRRAILGLGSSFRLKGRKIQGFFVGGERFFTGAWLFFGAWFFSFASLLK
jgi:hypothetical protein